MNKRKMTFATAQKIRDLRKEHKWGKVRLQRWFKEKEGYHISLTSIQDIIGGKTYLTRVQMNRRMGPEHVRIARRLAHLGRRPEWISCFLETEHGVVVTAGAIRQIIARRNWAHVT